MHHTNQQLTAKHDRMKYMLQKYQCFICPKPLSPKRFSPSLFCLSPHIQVFSSLFSELLIVRNNMGPECAFAKYTPTSVLFPHGEWLIRAFHKDWTAHIHVRLQGGVAGQLTSQGGRAKGPRWPGFKFLSSTQAVWPLAGYLTALCFYFLNWTVKVEWQECLPHWVPVRARQESIVKGTRLSVSTQLKITCFLLHPFPLVFWKLKDKKEFCNLGPVKYRADD